MATKRIKKQFWLTEEQAEDLRRKAGQAHVSEVMLIRMLLDGYHPPEAPGIEFFECMNRLTDQSEKLEKLSKRVQDLQTRNILFDESVELSELRINLIRKYLTGKEEKSLWL